MQRHMLVLAVIISVFVSPFVSAQEYAMWRISVKVFGDSHDAGAYQNEFEESLERGNELLAATGHNVRLDLIEIVELRDLDAWNNMAVDCGTRLRQLDQLAPFYSERYAYRHDAINVYYLRCGGRSNGASRMLDGNVIVLRPTGEGGLTLLHEVGHHMGLAHPHANDQEVGRAVCPEMARNGSSRWLTPGDDGLWETLPLHECWTADDLALRFYGTRYQNDSGENNLPQIFRDRVDGTLLNVMSRNAAVIRYDTSGSPVPMNGPQRLIDAQMREMRRNESLSRSNEVRRENQRSLPHAPYLDDAVYNAARRTLRNEFDGSGGARTTWTGFSDWIGAISFENVGGFLYGYAYSRNLGSGGQLRHRITFRQSLYSDAIFAVVPQEDILERTGRDDLQITLTARKLSGSQLQMRVATFTEDTSPLFQEETFVMTCLWGSC